MTRCGARTGAATTKLYGRNIMAELNIQFLHPTLGAIGGRIVAPETIPGGRPAVEKLIDERRAVWTMQVPDEGITVIDDGGVLRPVDDDELKAWTESKTHEQAEPGPG